MPNNSGCKYHHEAQQRLLRVLKALRGREFDGITPGDIAKAVETSAANVTRDLANLEEAGFAERLPGAEDRWRLGVQLVQIAQQYQNALARIRAQVEEMARRYDTGSR